MILMEETCLGCGLCAAHCPPGAIALKREFEVVPAVSAAEAWQRFVAEKAW
jgi:Fe-S-cluster-containing hydrogenase component 2